MDFLIDDVLKSCAARKIRLSINSEGGLRVTNSQALTAPLRAALKQHKEQIVRELSLSLFDYALLLFPGVEIDPKGRKIKPEQADGFNLA